MLELKYQGHKKHSVSATISWAVVNPKYLLEGSFVLPLVPVYSPLCGL